MKQHTEKVQIGEHQLLLITLSNEPDALYLVVLPIKKSRKILEHTQTIIQAGLQSEGLDTDFEYTNLNNLPVVKLTGTTNWGTWDQDPRATRCHTMSQFFA